MFDYLSKVCLASIQWNHRRVVGDQHLPEEGQGLCEGGGGPEVGGGQLHLHTHRQMEQKEQQRFCSSYKLVVSGIQPSQRHIEQHGRTYLQ